MDNETYLAQWLHTPTGGDGSVVIRKQDDATFLWKAGTPFEIAFPTALLERLERNVLRAHLHGVLSIWRCLGIWNPDSQTVWVISATSRRGSVEVTYDAAQPKGVPLRVVKDVEVPYFAYRGVATCNHSLTFDDLDNLPK